MLTRKSKNPKKRDPWPKLPEEVEMCKKLIRKYGKNDPVGALMIKRLKEYERRTKKQNKTD